MMRIRADKLSKKYNRRAIFQDISFDLGPGESLAVTGHNGSGKSTLCKVVAGLIRPSSGSLTIEIDGVLASKANLLNKIGMVSPYLQLYRELNPLENATFFANIQGRTLDMSRFKELMKRMGLAGRELDKLATFSSGMLQRMKYVVALYSDPLLLILDEPTANLDVQGAKVVYDIMASQQEERILIVATNEPDEIKLGKKNVGLDP